MNSRQSPHNTLVIGADSTIGCTLMSRLKTEGHRVIGTSYRTPAPANRCFLDLAQDPTNWKPPVPISTAFLFAAVTRDADCRADIEGSHKINVTHTVKLARQLAAQGAHVIFPSTSLVFDGSLPQMAANAPPNPQTEYGRQKAEAERALMAALGPQLSILRVTKVITPGYALFVQWREQLSTGQSVEAFADMHVAPVALSHAIDALMAIGISQTPGIFQLSASEDVTYAELARIVARQVGATPDAVVEVSGAERGIPAENRPLYTSLDTSGLMRTFAISAPNVEDVVHSALHEP